MNIWNWFSRRRQETTVAEIVMKAVLLTRESVRPLVSARLAGMGTHEARGYIRARAGHIIRDAVAMVTAHERDYHQFRTETLCDSVVEALVRTFHARPQTATRRRAA